MKIQTSKIYIQIDNAINDGYRVVSLQGGARSSKTYNTCIWLIIYLMRHPYTVLSVVRGTIPSLKKSVLRDFQTILQRMDMYKDSNFNKTELCYRFDNGSFIEFFSTDDEQKIRGAKRDILFINEANEIGKLAYSQLMMRTTQFAIIDYNPSFNDSHWIADVNKRDNTYHFVTTYKDNPFLEQAVVDEIESFKDKNKTLWEIYGLGIQSAVEGLVFPSITLVDSLPSYGFKKIALSMDFGFHPDPTAIVLCGIQGDKLFIDEVVYRTEMLTRDITAILKQYKDYKVISESADPRLVQEIANAGVWIKPVKKYAGSIEAGLTYMKQLKIHVTKQSTNVIKEFRNYIYDKTKDGTQLGVPVDAYNHSIDAARYYCLTELMGRQETKLIDKNEYGLY